MAKLANLVHETTQSSGTLGPANAITLLGAAAYGLTFDSQLSSSDTVIITVWDPTSKDGEIMKATFTSPATLTPVATRIWSTDGGLGGSAINWPASGERDVYVSAWASALESLIDPDNQGTGLLARTAADTYTNRTIQGGTHITVTNGDGVAGDPTVDDSLLSTRFARKDQAETFAADVEIQGDLFLPTRLIEGASGESAIRFPRTGANDYRLDVQEGAAFKRVAAVTAGAGAADARKAIQLDASGADFVKGVVLTPPSGGDAGKLVVVNSGETGFEASPNEPLFERIDKKSSDDAKRVDGTEYLIGELSDLAMPGGAGDGSRQLFVEFELTFEEDGSDSGTVRFRLRMGTNGTTADASVWDSSYNISASGSKDVKVSALLTIPSAATKLSVTSQRTTGSSQYTVKGQSESGTLRNAPDASPVAAFLRARTVAPVS